MRLMRAQYRFATDEEADRWLASATLVSVAPRLYATMPVYNLDTMHSTTYPVQLP